MSKNTSLSVIVLLALSSCMSQPPAPVEDKSSHVYTDISGKQFYQINESTSYAKRLSVEESHSKLADNAPNEEIAVSELKPIADEPKKQEESKEEIVQDLSQEKKQSASKSLVEENDIGRAFKTKYPLNNSAYIWPYEGKVLQGFGKHGNKFNEGMNIAGNLGDHVQAIGDGKVVYKGENIEGYGNLLIIKHDSKYMSAYAHLDSMQVERNAAVKKGDVIGTIGKSGNAKSPQLHFSIRKGKKTIDPEATDSAK